MQGRLIPVVGTSKNRRLTRAIPIIPAYPNQKEVFRHDDRAVYD